QPDRVVARAVGVPFAVGAGIPERTELPDGGWEEVIRWAHSAAVSSPAPNAVSAREIMALPPYRGRGVSQLILPRLRESTRAPALHGPRLQHGARFREQDPRRRDRAPVWLQRRAGARGRRLRLYEPSAGHALGPRLARTRHRRLSLPEARL